jgi:putative ABC transport system permease protein
LKAIFLLVKRSFQLHFFATVITLCSVALASGLMLSVFSIKTQSRQAFILENMGFDAVLGTRGSDLQLVLNAVYHLETSPGNIPWSLFQNIKRHMGVKLAIPYALGDNYHGYRIIGTNTDLFNKFKFKDDTTYRFKDGRAFKPEAQEAVVGSFVADAMNLKVGDKINPYHGLIYDEKAKHAQSYTITGILEPTNTPNDRVLWIPIDLFFRMEGHVLRGSGKEFTAKKGEAIPDEHKELSAVMIQLRNPMSGMMLNQMINRQGNVATLAYPIARVILDFFDKMGWMIRVLELIAVLTLIVAAAGILASLYNTLHERRQEFAILRALGARKSTVFSVILGQSISIALLGCFLGYGVYAGIMSGVAIWVKSNIGVILELWIEDPIFWINPLVHLGMGLLAGLIPAFKAYRTDVSSNLS